MSSDCSPSGSTRRPTNHHHVSTSWICGEGSCSSRRDCRGARRHGRVGRLIVAAVAEASAPRGEQGGEVRAHRRADRRARPHRDRARCAPDPRAPRGPWFARRRRALGARRLRRTNDGASHAGASRPAAGEQRLLRPPLGAGRQDRHHRQRRDRLPLLRWSLLRVPSAGRVRCPQRTHRRRRRRRHGSLGRRADRAWGLSTRRRCRLGVLLRLLRRASTLAVRYGTGGGGAGVRARRNAGPRTEHCIPACRAQRVRRDPAQAADECRRRAVDPPLCLPVPRGPERPAADSHLAPGLRDCDRGHGRCNARDAHAERGGCNVAQVRHGLLDVLLARTRAVPARLPAVRRPAAREARDVGRAVRRRPHAHRRIREAATCVHGHERGPRCTAPLGLEAVDGADRLGRRSDAPDLGRRWLDDRRRQGADEARCVSRPGDRNRLGGEPRELRRTARHPRCRRSGPEDGDP